MERKIHNYNHSMQNASTSCCSQDCKMEKNEHIHIQVENKSSNVVADDFINISYLFH